MLLSASTLGPATLLRMLLCLALLTPLTPFLLFSPCHPFVFALQAHFLLPFSMLLPPVALAVSLVLSLLPFRSMASAFLMMLLLAVIVALLHVSALFPAVAFAFLLVHARALIPVLRAASLLPLCFAVALALLACVPSLMPVVPLACVFGHFLLRFLALAPALAAAFSVPPTCSAFPHLCAKPTPLRSPPLLMLCCEVLLHAAL